MPGLLRRRGPSSDVDMRRHSFVGTDASNDAIISESRSSEQIPRRPSAADFLSPVTAAAESSKTTPATEGEKVVSPPVQQDEPSKNRHFSMLKFRHASDSQLSTRARLQAYAGTAPPVPQRTCNDDHYLD